MPIGRRLTFIRLSPAFAYRNGQCRAGVCLPDDCTCARPPLDATERSRSARADDRDQIGAICSPAGIDPRNGAVVALDLTVGRSLSVGMRLAIGVGGRRAAG